MFTPQQILFITPTQLFWSNIYEVITLALYASINHLWAIEPFL